MDATPDLVTVARALSDHRRVSIVMALMDGRPMPATRLAVEVGVAPSTASAHLRTLVEAGILKVQASAYHGGQYRMFRIASSEVAELCESITQLAVVARNRVKSLDPTTPQWTIRTARMCYDHLAGRLGVAVMTALQDRSWLIDGDGGLSLGPEADSGFARIGIDLDTLRQGQRRLLRSCIDVSEQCPHLSGALGAAVASQCERLGWIQRSPANRSLTVTPEGVQGLRSWIDLDVERTGLTLPAGAMTLAQASD